MRPRERERAVPARSDVTALPMGFLSPAAQLNTIRIDPTEEVTLHTTTKAAKATVSGDRVVG